MDVIVSIPDHCLSIYFSVYFHVYRKLYLGTSVEWIKIILMLIESKINKACNIYILFKSICIY